MSISRRHWFATRRNSDLKSCFQDCISFPHFQNYGGSACSGSSYLPHRHLSANRLCSLNLCISSHTSNYECSSFSHLIPFSEKSRPTWSCLLFLSITFVTTLPQLSIPFRMQSAMSWKVWKIIHLMFHLCIYSEVILQSFESFARIFFATGNIPMHSIYNRV